MNELQPSTSGAGGTTPSSGVLRTKISLKSGTVVPPFHTFKMQLPPQSEIQGNHDLLTSYGLGPLEGGHIGGRRVKESLSSFLPHVMGKLHFEATKDASSLRALIEKPPIHKEITNLSSSAMQGFKLSDGPVDERYKHLFEKRHDSRLHHNEKMNVVRLRPAYDPYGFDEDETEKGFPKKHKKKKKDKKRKKDKESGDVEKKKKREERMEF